MTILRSRSGPFSRSANRLRKYRKLLLLVPAVFVVLAGVGLFVLDLRYSVIRETPPVDHESFTDLHPSVRVFVNPSRAGDRLGAVLEQRLGRPVPGWVVDAILPHALSLIVFANHDSGRIEMSGMLNTRRLDPLIREMIDVFDIAARYPEIAWSEQGVIRAERGVLLHDASVVMEAEAKEAAWYVWKHGFEPRPLPLEGNHLIEVVFDNRDGGAYLAVASLLNAYGFNLDEEEEDIGLTSLQFVRSARLEIDFVADDAVAIRFSLDVVPGTRNRMAVVNMKVGLDRVFTEAGERAQERHDLTLSGDSEWKGDTLEFDYRLRPADRFIEQILGGEFF
ncbi:MAG: hypothetical protein IID08_06340 [Candidatus Hydrogenedentes bacterium]|nr:hypothetical protein [Candidatus Hydrogenedentota bacterium]